ncbi:exportin 1A [Tanacetum coccineum]
MLSSFCLCGGKNESQLIQELCLYVLPGYQHLKRTDLICSTLAASHAFLSWIPLCYIFESTLMQTFLKIFPVPSYRNLILQCWTEVAALNLRDSYNGQYVYMYNIFIVQPRTGLGKQTKQKQSPNLSCEAALSGCWAETKTKLKEKKLKVEDGLNSTKVEMSGFYESAYGEGGIAYTQLEARMALSQNISVPWITCRIKH